MFEDRLAYPDNHIEVDNRLAFFLGSLDATYGDNAIYVHLVRDREEIARSYRRRWYYRGSIVRAFYLNVLQSEDYDASRFDDACRYYVDVNHANIEHFLKDKSRTFTFDVENGRREFERFVSWLGVPCADEGYALWEERANLNKAKRLGGGLSGLAVQVVRTARAMRTIFRDV